jgi:hypothetical protein
MLNESIVTENPMQHIPSSQGDGDPGLQDSATLAVLRTTANQPFESAFEELTRALIKAAAVRRNLPVPRDGQILMGSYLTFQRIAAQALALVDDSSARCAKAEAIQDVCGEQEWDLLGPEAAGVRDGIDRYQAKLAHLGGQVRR